MGVAVSPDPMPQEAIFVRSDHYRFVTRGVPAILLMTGYANGGEAQWKNFLGKVYHSPSDDLDPADRLGSRRRATASSIIASRARSPTPTSGPCGIAATISATASRRGRAPRRTTPLTLTHARRSDLVERPDFDPIKTDFT